MRNVLDIFETPVTVTPQQEISKTLNSSKIPSNYLTFTFGERTFTYGERTFTFGEGTLLLGIIGVFGVFGISFFVLGVFGTPWVGGPRRGFRKYLSSEGEKCHKSR